MGFDDSLAHILSSGFGSFLQEPLDPKALDVHIGHGSVASRRHGLVVDVTGLLTVLVFHHVYCLRLEALPYRLGRLFQAIIDGGISVDPASARWTKALVKILKKKLLKTSPYWTFIRAAKIAGK